MTRHLRNDVLARLPTASVEQPRLLVVVPQPLLQRRDDARDVVVLANAWAD